MTEVLIPAEELPTHWYDALTAVAESTWDVLMRHPWALQSLQNAAAGPNAMRHFEQSLAALADTGLTVQDKFALLAIVDDYVHGNVIRTAEYSAAASAPMDDELIEAAIRFAETQYATGDFPHTQAMFGGEDPREMFPRILGDATDRDRFRNGLAMLLAGAAHKLNLSLPG